MSKFVKERFHYHGGYLTYEMPNGTRQFIARFKYRTCTMSEFRAFLIKNFTVEEYLAERQLGVTPLTALGVKGFVPKALRGSEFFGMTQSCKAREREIAWHQQCTRKAA